MISLTRCKGTVVAKKYDIMFERSLIKPGCLNTSKYFWTFSGSRFFKASNSSVKSLKWKKHSIWTCWKYSIKPVYEYLASKHSYPDLWEEVPTQVYGKDFPKQVCGKDFPTQVPGKDFPTDVRRNCILSIILPSGGDKKRFCCRIVLFQNGSVEEWFCCRMVLP